MSRPEDFDERAKGWKRTRALWRALGFFALVVVAVIVASDPSTLEGYAVVPLLGIALWAADRANINTQRLRRPENKRRKRERKRARVERAIARRNQEG